MYSGYVHKEYSYRKSGEGQIVTCKPHSPALSAKTQLGMTIQSQGNSDEYQLRDGPLRILVMLALIELIANMSAFSVRLHIYVCTTLLANNREEENRDVRPSHFLSFSYYFKLLSCCIRPVKKITELSP